MAISGALPLEAARPAHCVLGFNHKDRSEDPPCPCIPNFSQIGQSRDELSPCTFLSIFNMTTLSHLVFDRGSGFGIIPLPLCHCSLLIYKIWCSSIRDRETQTRKDMKFQTAANDGLFLLPVPSLMGIRMQNHKCNEVENAMKWRMLFRFSKWIAL